MRRGIKLEEFLEFLESEFKSPFSIYDVVEKFSRGEYWIREKVRWLVAYGHVEIIKFYLSNTQKEYLRMIARNYGLEEFTCNEVCKLRGVRRHAARKMLEKLVSWGYLQKRKPSPNRAYYSLTPQAILALYIDGKKRTYYITKQALNSLDLEELIKKI